MQCPLLNTSVQRQSHIIVQEIVASDDAAVGYDIKTISDNIDEDWKVVEKRASSA